MLALAREPYRPVAAPLPPPGPRLRSDQSLGGLARVRRWEHDGGEPSSGRAAAAHAAVELSWVDQGSIAYRVGARTFAAPAGAVVVVPHGAEHVTSFGPAVRAGALWISPEVVDEVASALGQPGAARSLEPGHVEGAPEVQTLARLLAAELSAGQRGCLLAAEGMLEALVVRTLRVAARSEAARPGCSASVRAAVELVHARYAEPLGVDELARAAAMSRFHFSRRFRAEVGLSPYRYLVRVRVERAAELLRGGRHDVTQAALEVGFGDLGRFARAFRARFGHPPSRHVGRGAL